MKSKLRTILLSTATVGLTVTPFLFATSCTKANYDNLFFTVKNEAGLEIEFCDRGASIYSMKLNDATTNTSTYLTYHPQDKTTFIDPNNIAYYYGKTLGRVAGRFENGEFELDGKKYQLQHNEKNADKDNCLHGGYDAFSFRDFTRYVTDVKGDTEEDDRKVIAFNYVSPAGEAGFPETIDTWIIYSLYKNVNVLDTTLLAIPTGKTVINLSTHSLFRLGNDGDVLGYELTIPTATRAKYKNDGKGNRTNQVVVGTKSVTEDNNIFNFQTAKKIGKDIEAAKEYDPVSGGYDHIWYFDPATSTENRFVNLYNPTNKINLKVTATSNSITGFILYSNDYPRAGQIMSDGKEDTLYAGITIEPYTFFTKDDLSPIIYTPEEPFYNSFTYEITKKS